MAKGSVVLVAHNSSGWIESSLQALCAESDWEIVLIDNASSDDTRERVTRFANRVRIIANAENRGFAGAVNQAVKLATGSVIVALNPDTVPQHGALDCLARILDTKTGAAGGMLLDQLGKPQLGFLVRRFPTLASALSEVLLLNRLWPSNPWNSRYRCLDLDYSRSQEVDQPAGAALAFRRHAWEQAGGLDELFYPVWFEDVDFCLRLRQLQWRIVYCPEAVFRHAGGHSVSRLSFCERQHYWYANLLRYFRKHHGRVAVVLLRVGIAFGMLLRSLAALCGAMPESVKRLHAIRAYAAVTWRYGILGAAPARNVTPLLEGSSALRR
jgi:GT2 family glycosyltransferase